MDYWFRAFGKLLSFKPLYENFFRINKSINKERLIRDNLLLYKVQSLNQMLMRKFLYGTFRAFRKSLSFRPLYKSFFRINKSINKERLIRDKSAIIQSSIFEPDAYAKIFIWNSGPNNLKKKIFSEGTSQLTSKNVNLETICFYTKFNL